MTDRISHILIADDTPENIRVLGTALRRDNYRLSIAQNGLQVLKAVEEHIPDLILLDVMMPDMDGFQVCEALKNDSKTEDIEIIFVTAAVATSDELKGLQLGAVDYIHKPFSIPLIQAKVELHLERAHSKRELRLKNEALEENARLREDIERITRHDLKNPLNALIGFPQLMLEDDNLTEDQRGYLEEMLKAGNEMLNMINNSLDLFKMETGRYQYNPDIVDIGAVIKNVVKDLRLLIADYRVHVEIRIQDSQMNQAMFLVHAEKSLSYSLFANLIRNAIEACSAGDNIVIAMQHENNEGVIKITNPGTVPESIRDGFFEKYTTAGKAHGTGLGTYSAKLITEVQKGKISMETDEKQTTLTVRLPAMP